jgi:O-antigen/teichoic acid export membrane protein
MIRHQSTQSPFNIRDEEYLKALTKSAGLGTFGEIFSLILLYITVILITRTVGADIYGLFLLSQAVVRIAVLIGALGLPHAVLRFVAAYKAKNNFPKIRGIILFSLRTVLTTSIILSVILFIGAPLISSNIFHVPEMAVFLRILTISLPFWALLHVLFSSLQSFKKIKFIVFVEKGLMPIIRLLLLIFFFLIQLFIFGLLAATVISTVICFVGSFFYLLKTVDFRSHKKDIVYEKSKWISFSLPLLLSGFIFLLITTTDILMLGFFKTSASVGIYGASAKIAVLTTVFLTSFYLLFKPIISELVANQEISRLSVLLKTVNKLNFLVSFPIFLCLLMFSRDIISLFGKQFSAGATTLVILLCGQFCYILAGGTFYIFAMIGKPKIELFNAGILVFLNIGLNVVLIPKLNIIGAALSSAISILVVNIISLIETYLFLRVHIFRPDLFKPIIAGGIPAILIHLILKWKVEFPIHKILLILLFFTFYTLILILLKFEKNEIFLLRVIMQKIKSLKIK